MRELKGGALGVSPDSGGTSQSQGGAFAGRLLVKGQKEEKGR